MSAEPMVKQMANLEGARMMMGRNREKARTENSSPAPSSARNQVKFIVFGMLDCALQRMTACFLSPAYKKTPSKKWQLRHHGMQASRPLCLIGKHAKVQAN